ncbi:MAG: type II toxin-antitoxin system HicA family toxin [Alkalinema sp. RU_4_3]|nr:type II toxin-antitoxin system HicA family toxin [Alkalinema sp. RU_4_3]
MLRSTQRNITFAELEKLLLALGFQKVNQLDYSIFQHPATKAMVSLPKYEFEVAVQPLHLNLTRRILDNYGLMSTAAFDGLNQTPSISQDDIPE